MPDRADQPPRHRVPPILLERARAMRHDASPIELKLWRCLRNRQLSGLKFRRQHPVGPFIADFLCPELKLIVELDGDSHAKQMDYDARRTLWLEENGYHVARYWNHDVTRNLVDVLESILARAEAIRGDGKAPSP